VRMRRREFRAMGRSRHVEMATVVVSLFSAFFLPR
jgi:hypothetical protein